MNIPAHARMIAFAVLVNASAAGLAQEPSDDEAQASDDGAESGCGNAMSTPEINECMRAIYDRSDERRARYLAAALEQNAERAELVTSLEASAAAFVEYRKAECGAVYDSYGFGTLRTAAYLDCATRLTDQRTHVIWQNWLTYVDSTEAVLPEPEPTQ